MVRALSIAAGKPDSKEGIQTKHESACQGYEQVIYSLDECLRKAEECGNCPLFEWVSCFSESVAARMMPSAATELEDLMQKSPNRSFHLGIEDALTSIKQRQRKRNHRVDFHLLDPPENSNCVGVNHVIALKSFFLDHVSAISFPGPVVYKHFALLKSNILWGGWRAGE